MATTAWFFRATAAGAWIERLVAAAACVAAGVAAVWLPPLVSLAVLDVILAVTVTVLTRAHRRLRTRAG
ncbi:hypothetical protein OIE66_17375 [Nonomuraea sp. NBC_01738]|uniref:hypothetical protein n=1 Tax=Nonomuraea sp. NBC_01738 TaxID=2976003 RepID=UPI002E161160|nr:hypothetical protein OIE66_17375 [Nonomuraea sp. NBC_01738]